MVVEALGAEWHEECFRCVVGLEVSKTDASSDGANANLGMPWQFRGWSVLLERGRRGSGVFYL